MHEELSTQNWYQASSPIIKGGHKISNHIAPIFTRIEKDEIERLKSNQTKD
jgi:hypothetical protein